MRATIINIKKSLNIAYFRQAIKRSDVEMLKISIRKLFQRINEKEFEENQKNIISDLLKETWYSSRFEINTKDRIDLAIHNGKTAKDSVGVIIEVKRPTSSERITQENVNCKALHELILYYFDERNENENTQVKHLIATNIYEWFIFDENEFDKIFYRNNKFQKLYKSKIEQGKDNPFFYTEAQKIVAGIEDEITCTHFNFKDYEKVATNNESADDDQLIELYKILSPEHLLKLSFANDSNSLNREFYNELLHIIGLEEVKVGGKKIIDRKVANNRNEGSLLENTIATIISEDCIDNISNPEHYGETLDERLFSASLELCINWLNRVLFLKLLEGQLISYHRGNKDFSFVNSKLIEDYDELNELFFDVLAMKTDERSKSVSQKFGNIPYLNSSLFEKSNLEKQTIRVNSLKNRFELPIYKNTVMKDAEGKQVIGTMPTLQYLFNFLDAYDFSSDSSAKIQEQNKTIINASVLGLIFEKINGYKDGSFFTPGFITMYMCRETLRRAVVQKFNEYYPSWNITEFDNLKDKIEYTDKSKRHEANAIINSLKICDPAVGSGHFLVSALNELISIKSDLHILQFRDGSRIQGCKISIDNDELIIINEETDLSFLYTLNQNNKPLTELQKLQEALFHEKETLIEDCLFGVDINPKSVMICRLRLWIELLKNAYYTEGSKYTELETLPNIDINIKTGNSLVSKFSTNNSISNYPAVIQQKIRLATTKYKELVLIYKSTSDKTTKKNTEKEIARLKEEFSSISNPNDADWVKLREKKAELGNTPMFFNREEQEAWILKTELLTAEIEVLEKAYNEKLKTLYGNAFEWRFEFPEVLDVKGDFVGFDVVIGNPPYIRQEDIKDFKYFFKDNYETYTSTSDLYVFFVEKGFQILGNNGSFCYIFPNKWMQASYGKPLRAFLLKQHIESLVDFGDLQVFDEATTYPCVFGASKKVPSNSFESITIKTLNYEGRFDKYASSLRCIIKTDSLSNETWVVSSDSDQKLLIKLKKTSLSLSEFIVGNSYRGILTGLTEAFLINDETKERLIKEDKKSVELIKPFLLGRNIKPYIASSANNWLILVPKGFTIKRNLPSSDQSIVCEPPPRYGNMPYDEAWEWFKGNYPAIANHLIPFKTKAMQRTDKGDYWWELRACDYYDKFEKPKIMYQVMQVKPCFIYDESGQYCNNSMWIIPSEDKILLAILNSKMGWWLISKYCTAIQNGYQLIWKYFGQIPIHRIQANREEIVALVDKVIVLKNQNIETSHIESEIDHLVYQLYELTEEEIAIVEGIK
ncbi:MAG: Eco57I restriction-modification methylase domain-containing protein [Bacteroidales bacterium]|nr:Eco57I restriction-modification methylase domain-containing protein [Bacteroidales bacterium]